MLSKGMAMSPKTKFSALIAIFLWASAFVGIRAGLKEYSPEGLALLRFLIASFLMGIIYFRLPKRSAISLLDKFGLLAVGVLGIGIYNLTLNYGELSIASGMASFIISQSPLITTLIAIAVLGERLNKLCVLGFMVSLFGVSLIAMGEKIGFEWDSNLFYIFIATLAAGFYSVLQKPYLAKYQAIEVTTYIIWGGTLFLLFYTPLLQEDLLRASFKTTLIVVYLGIFPAAVGYLAWSYALAREPASRIVSFLYFMPPLATLLGGLWLDEVPVWLSILGGMIAVLGVFLVNYSFARLKIANATT